MRYIAALQAVEPGSEGLCAACAALWRGLAAAKRGARPACARKENILELEDERLAVNALLHPLIQQRMLEQEGVFRDMGAIRRPYSIGMYVPAAD
jgi:dephospho-CoA kinase